jgi:hypothetical protein
MVRMKCLPRRRMLPLGGTVVVLLTGLGASPAIANTSKSVHHTATSTSGRTALRHVHGRQNAEFQTYALRFDRHPRMT